MKIKREAYIAVIKNQLNDLNLELADIQTKVANAKAVAHARYAEEMMALREQAQQVSNQLEKIKAASDDTWESMIGSTEKIKDAFVNSFHLFKAQLKEK